MHIASLQTLAGMGQDIFGADKKKEAGGGGGGGGATPAAPAGGGGGPEAPKAPAVGGMAGTFDPNYQVSQSMALSQRPF